jgi:NodT family efflux transporter outer membrane factor (OMF) lipoprotein
MRGAKLLPILTAMLLSGCAAVPHIQPQVAQLQAPGLGLDTASPPPAARWWDRFGDPQLGQLIDAGLADNPTLDMALARLRAAQAGISSQKAELLPQVSGDASLSGQRFSDVSLIPPPYAGTHRAVADAQISLSWDLDLFGRQKAIVASARSSAEATRLDAEAARLAVSIAIAQTYIDLTRAERQILVAQGFVETRERSLAYISTRSQNRLSADFDLRTAQTLLAQARQARVRAERQRDLMIHALAELTGRGAQAYAAIATPVLALDHAPDVPQTLPADLLGRRPDLLAAQARIDASVATRRAARASFYPDVNLQALAGLSSIGLGNFLTAGAGTYGGGGALHLPLFEGGKLRAQYGAATAGFDEAVADYNGDVLKAVREAADAITGVRSADADVALQGEVVAGLRDTVRLDQVRTATGLGSRLDAIDSGFRLLEAEQALLNLQADTLIRRVQLIAAQSGDFDPNAPHVAASKTESRS